MSLGDLLISSSISFFKVLKFLITQVRLAFQDDKSKYFPLFLIWNFKFQDYGNLSVSIWDRFLSMAPRIPKSLCWAQSPQATVVWVWDQITGFCQLPSYRLPQEHQWIRIAAEHKAPILAKNLVLPSLAVCAWSYSCLVLTVVPTASFRERTVSKVVWMRMSLLPPLATIFEYLVSG